MSKERVPVIPLRDIVLFPGMILPLWVARAKTLAAIDSGGPVFFVAQRHGTLEAPCEGDLFDLGTVGDILQTAAMPDGTLKILVKGLRRARRLVLRDNERFLEADLAFPDDEIADALFDAAKIDARVMEAVRANAPPPAPWPVSMLQKLLEDDSLTGAARLDRLRRLPQRE